MSHTTHALFRSGAYVSKVLRRSSFIKLSRHLIAVLLISAMATMSVPPVVAHSVVSITVADSAGLIGQVQSMMASLWWPFGSPREGSSQQEQQPVAPPSEQELEARVARLEMSPQGEVLMVSGQTQVMSAIPLDADENIVHGVVVKWRSDNSQIVSITEDGVASASLPGMASLTATAGQKQETLRVTVIERERSVVAGDKAQGANLVRTRSSTSSKSTSSGGSQLFGHRGKFSRFAIAPVPEQPYDADPLPDDETESLYTTENAIGAPPGRMAPSAATPPAAVSGRENAGSANFNFGVPLLNLPGRAGLNVSLALVYNSRLWNKSTTSNNTTRMSYDVDNGWPAPGFRLGYGQLENQTGSYTLTDPDGTRHEMIYRAPGDYKTIDGTFITYNSSTHLVIYPDGTQIQYGAEGTTASGAPGKRSYPVKITDRNGNFILINYRSVGGQQVGPRIVSIRDTMQRIVRFLYAGGGDHLTSITAPGYQNSSPDRAVVRFIYDELTISGTFASGISVSKPPTPIKVIRYAYFRGTKSGYRFDYSPFGMINQIVQLRDMATDAEGVVSEGETAASTRYNFPADANPTTPLGDVPKYNQRIDSYWNNGSMVTLPPTTFAVNETLGTTTVTAPDFSQTITTVYVKEGQWDDGLVSKVERKKGGVLLSKSVYSWERDASLKNPRVYKIDLTNDASPGQTRTIIASYGAFNNVETMYECDFNVTCAPQDAAQKALRRTETTYVEDRGWTERGLVHLPQTVKVFEGTSTSPAAWVDYHYDEYTSPAGAALTARNDIVMHDDAYDPYAPPKQVCDANGCHTVNVYDPATDQRGNLTSVTTYANAGAIYPGQRGASTNKSFYDIAGNVVTEEVNCCQQKQYTYTFGYRYAYPTKELRGSGPQLETEATYDFNTGLVLSSTDENNQKTTYSYSVETLRLMETTRPDTGYTRYTYEDGLPSFVKAETLLDTSTTTGDRTVESLQYTNGLGRVTRSFGPLTSDGQSGNVRVTSDIEYDNMGRVFRVSNPYYSSGGMMSAVNPSGLWTRRAYDGLGRVKTVTLADNNTVTITYGGNLTTVTDEAGKQRRQKTDALGRLIRLDEPDEAGELGEAATPSRATRYEYDVLDNLTQITQGGQVRSFKYDSLSRLTHERQVEAEATLNEQGQAVATGGSWTGVYKYDSQGLLTDSYDARGIHAYYTYDGLNRLDFIDYSDATPSVDYIYDQAVGAWLNRGRLTEVQTKVAGVVKSSQKYNYTKMGQVGQHSQTVNDGTPYVTKYVYNLAGQLTQESYPSQRTVKYGYDDAGRLESVAEAGRTYASGFKYAAHGGLLEEAWGENPAIPLQHAMAYNKRLQVSQIKLTMGGVERKRYDYAYGEVNASTGWVNTTKNTGQIGRIESFVEGVKGWQQRYSYDEMGRLTLASQSQSEGAKLDWQTDYQYDRFGNRYQSSAQNTGITFTPVQMGEISQTTNRFISKMSYDDAGNVTVNRYRNKQYKYDANGRQYWMADADNNQIGVATALYDGAGQRVETTANGERRQMVYDAFGQLIAEYKQVNGVMVLERESLYRLGQEVAIIQADGTASYSLRDHQGSVRAEVTQAGRINASYDYLPYGEELQTDPLLDPPIENVPRSKQRYGGLYRDEAGSLDHAWWRKYDSTLGRWTTPDPYNGSMSITDPQSFNRYSYVENDPVNLIDPSGLDDEPLGDGPEPGDVIEVFTFESLLGGGGGNSLLDRADLNREPINKRVMVIEAGLKRPQDTKQQSSNPNCLQNAVEGSPGVGRPFATNPKDPSIASHNGAHALSPDHRARVSTLEALQGHVIYTNRQDSQLFLADVRLPNGNVAAYLDLQSVSVRAGQQLGTGDTIGTVRAAGDPRNQVGLHLSLIRGEYYNQYRRMRQQGAIGFPTKFFIDPLGPNSPVNCSP